MGLERGKEEGRDREGEQREREKDIGGRGCQVCVMYARRGVDTKARQTEKWIRWDETMRWGRARGEPEAQKRSGRGGGGSGYDGGEAKSRMRQVTESTAASIAQVC